MGDIQITNKNKLLLTIYNKLYTFFGPQDWWPGDTPFEVAVGAILTQNANWSNVEKAIANLKEARLLSPSALQRVPARRMAALIRPSGYFNIKAKRLKAFVVFMQESFHGNMEEMKKLDTLTLRQLLLDIHGIGPETADSILLYALDKPVFVIDAYTRRVLSRHGIMDFRAPYEEYQIMFHRTMDNDVGLFNEYHALLVMVGKDFCKPRPLCEKCPLYPPLRVV